MAQFAALLRGVNVGPTTRVPMADLRELLEVFGAQDVKTHLNSGNALFHLHHSPKTIDAALTELISERFGFQIDVTCRTKKQLESVIALDPLKKLGEDDSKYIVAFMPSPPKPAAIKPVLAADYPAGETCAHKGREFYVFSPRGVAESQALKALNKTKPAAFATARNVRTIAKLIELIPPARK